MALIDLDLKNILVGKQIIGTITTELLTVISKVDPSEHKEKHIHLFLDQFLNKVDLTKSFNTELILIYDEVLPTEILTALHSWFYTKSSDINNIIVVTTHTIGATAWYNQYLQLFGVVGFKLIEAPLLSTRYIERLSAIPNLGITALTKNLKYYFSYYGGSYGSNERDYLAALVLDLKGGYVDYMSGFSSGINEFDNYLEQLTNFINRPLIDKLLQVRANSNFKKEGRIFNELFNMQGFQYRIDICSAAQVIRETSNCTPYSTITEKTIRSFLHFQIPIPISGVNCIDNLERLGFKIDYDIFNYSYQIESNFYKRTLLVSDRLTEFFNKYTLQDLENYVSAQSDLLCYNYNYIASGQLFKNVKENLIREING